GDVFGRMRGEPVLNGLDAVAEARVGHAEIFAEIEPPGLQPLPLETCERRIVLEADAARNGTTPDAWQACENPNQLVEVSFGFVVGDPIERGNQRRSRNWF